MRLKKVKLCGLALLLLCIAIRATATSSVFNFSAAQIEGSKQVSLNFDIVNSAASSVAISVLISNGISPIAVTSLSGHAGNNVPTGTGRQIIWDGGVDLNGVVTSNLSITLLVFGPAPSGMVHIPGGSNSGLTVTSFMMDATEVTKTQWDVVANSTTLLNASDGTGKGSSHPVHFITWIEAVKWCNARSAQEGLTACYSSGSWICDFSANGYRLPEKVEWEYAARGGLINQLYPWGSSINHSNANYYSSEEKAYHPAYASGVPFTSPVGSFEANGFGLYDMSGNVFEWCNDIVLSGRSLRGGSWGKKEIFQQCGNPSWSEATSNNEIGFCTIRNAPAAAMQTEVISFDSRDYTLTVASSYGLPTPAVGFSDYAWMSEVMCEIESGVLVGGTNFTCIGWAGAGSVSMVGSSNAVVVVLSNLSSFITWVWASDDADQDLMTDDWEEAYFGSLGQAATDDFDWDGQNNLSEFIAGTDPTNAASRFELIGKTIFGGIIVEWPGASNRIYNIYSTDNLVITDFQPLETNIAFPRNSITSTPASGRCFYKADVRK